MNTLTLRMFAHMGAYYFHIMESSTTAWLMGYSLKERGLAAEGWRTIVIGAERVPVESVMERVTDPDKLPQFFRYAIGAQLNYQPWRLAQVTDEGIDQTAALKMDLNKCVAAARGGQETLDVDGIDMSVKRYAGAQIARHLSRIARGEFGTELTPEKVEGSGLLQARVLILGEVGAVVDDELRKSKARA